MNGIELQDREFFAAIKEGREPNSSVAQVLNCYEVLASLERQLQSKHAKLLAAALKARGLPATETESHIVPLIVGDPVICKALTDRLLADFSIYVQPINYPTVPKGTERLRLTPGPLHGELEISKLVAALDELWTEMMLRRAA